MEFFDTVAAVVIGVLIADLLLAAFVALRATFVQRKMRRHFEAFQNAIPKADVKG